MLVPFKHNDPIRLEATERVSRWVHELVTATTRKPVTVMVREGRCGEPQYPPLETIVTVMRGPDAINQVHLHLPVVDVTAHDLRISFGVGI